MGSIPKSHKRIVTKREYLARVGRKTALRIGGLGLGSGGCLIFVLSVCFLCVAILLWPESALMGALWLAGFLLVLALAGATFHVSQKSMEKARHINTGVPLTRANAADLSANDSLVRASQEPAQAQEGVLLRAVAEGQERHEEQLLRASVNRHE